MKGNNLYEIEANWFDLFFSKRSNMNSVAVLFVSLFSSSAQTLKLFRPVASYQGDRRIITVDLQSIGIGTR